jgi:hypothetical protein
MAAELTGTLRTEERRRIGMTNELGLQYHSDGPSKLSEDAVVSASTP